MCLLQVGIGALISALLGMGVGYWLLRIRENRGEKREQEEKEERCRKQIGDIGSIIREEREMILFRSGIIRASGCPIPSRTLAMEISLSKEEIEVMECCHSLYLKISKVMDGETSQISNEEKREIEGCFKKVIDAHDEWSRGSNGRDGGLCRSLLDCGYYRNLFVDLEKTSFLKGEKL